MKSAAASCSQSLPALRKCSTSPGVVPVTTPIVEYLLHRTIRRTQPTTGRLEICSHSIDCSSEDRYGGPVAQSLVYWFCPSQLCHKPRLKTELWQNGAKIKTLSSMRMRPKHNAAVLPPRR